MNTPAAIAALRLAAERSRSPADQRALRAGAIALEQLQRAHEDLTARHESLLGSALQLIPEIAK